MLQMWTDRENVRSRPAEFDAFDRLMKPFPRPLLERRPKTYKAQLDDNNIFLFRQETLLCLGSFSPHKFSSVWGCFFA